MDFITEVFSWITDGIEFFISIIVGIGSLIVFSWIFGNNTGSHDNTNYYRTNPNNGNDYEIDPSWHQHDDDSYDNRSAGDIMMDGGLDPSDFDVYNEAHHHVYDSYDSNKNY